MSHLIPATVQVVCRNSMPGIRACLESLTMFAEVIVQDGNSTDGTREFAKTFPNVRLMDQNPAYVDLEGRIKDFSSMRNESIRAAKYDWVFVIDADEGVTPAQVAEARAIAEKNVPGVYVAFRRFVVDGEKVMWCSAYPALQIRLFHRSSVIEYRKPVHERLALQTGVHTQMLKEELLVPLPPAPQLEAKYHRYLMMEVKRASHYTMLTWLRWGLLRHVRSIASLIVRLAWIWLIPREGKRLPLAYEKQFIVHAWRVIIHTFPPLKRLRA